MQVNCIFGVFSGPVRRFKRMCELVESLMLAGSQAQHCTSARRISADLCSNSSSSSYSSIDRVSPTPNEEVQKTCFTSHNKDIPYRL